MEKYGLGWKDLNRRQPVSSESWWDVILNLILLVPIIYILIGGFSLLVMAAGEDVPYMSFWHAPWWWLFHLFGLV